MKIENYLKKFAVLVLLILLSIAYVLLVWHKGLILPGDDRIFHIERLEEAYQNLRLGHLPSLISTYSFSKIGQAINTYYPWGSLIPYAILRCIVKNPIHTYYGYIALEQFLGLSLAYLLGKELWHNRKTAMFFAVIFRFSTYMSFDDFARADFGEAWALVFVPLTILGLIKVLKDNNMLGAILLAMGLSLTLYSHILTTIISIVVLLIIYIVALVNKKTSLSKSLKYLTLSAVIFAGSTLAITIPILIGMHGTKISSPGTGIFKTKQISFTDLFHASVNNTVERSTPTVGIIVFATFLFGFLFLKEMRKWERKSYALGVIFIFLSTALFPWSLFTKTPIANIQFTWRLLPIASLFLAIYLAAIFNLKIKNKQIILGSTFLICIIFAYGGVQSYSVKQDEYSNAEQSLETKVQHPLGYNLTEYSYKKAVSLNQPNAYDVRWYGTDYLPQNAVEISDKIYTHMIEVNSKEYRIDNNSIKPSYNGEKYIIPSRWLNKETNIVTLPFIIYDKKNYSIQVNGEDVNFSINNHSQPIIKINKAQTASVLVQYHVPKVITISRYISAALFFFSIIGVLTIHLNDRVRLRKTME